MGIVIEVERKKMTGSSSPLDFLIGLFQPPTENDDGKRKQTFAMKKIIKDRISGEFLKELRNEIEILRDLDHPNIVKLYEIFDYRGQMSLILELCSGGDLWTRVPYPEKECAKIIKKLSSAVAHLHNHGIIHRDLKLENIMFENGSPEAEIKLLDFGLSKKFHPEEEMKRGVGTIYTMAPEVIKRDYTSQADMWSVGVITYVLLSDAKPFSGTRRKQVMRKIVNCQYDFKDRIWNYISKDAKTFVSQLIEKNPKKRLTPIQANGSRWLNLPEYTEQVDEDFMKNVHNAVVYHSDSHHLKKIALRIIAHNSSSESIMKLRKAFNQYDKNNDGVIDLSEFTATLREFGYDESTSKSIFERLDVDGSGDVYYTEFIASTLETLGLIKEDEIRGAFERMDTDSSGQISTANLKKLLGQDYDEKIVQDAVAEFDADGNGGINFEEFKQVFERPRLKEVIASLYANDT